MRDGAVKAHSIVEDQTNKMSANDNFDPVKEEKESAVEDEEDNCDGDDCQSIFPQRLMSILGDERNHDAICWLPNGCAFIIRSRASFAERIMPKFFSRKSKYSSFTRKLNRWNFMRIPSGPEVGAYYHEFFLRDKPHLAAQMFCKNARTKIAMASPDPSPIVALSASRFEPLAVQQQPPRKEQLAIDVAPRSLGGQQIDPAMQFLLEHQLFLGRQHVTSQLQMLQDPTMSMLRAQSSNTTVSSTLELEIQKKQLENLLQLQQLIALNRLNGQQKRRNNFRASAA